LRRLLAAADTRQGGGGAGESGGPEQAPAGKRCSHLDISLRIVRSRLLLDLLDADLMDLGGVLQVVAQGQQVRRPLAGAAGLAGLGRVGAGAAGLLGRLLVRAA